MNDAMPAAAGAPAVAFTPRLACDDPLAAYWLAQVTLRLRREVCWLWRERGCHEANPAQAPSSELPPSVDSALAALDGMRFDADKRRFFEEDEAARHLSAGIRAAGFEASGALPLQGSFSWVAAELALAPVECFLLAMALLPAVDSEAGAVIACCHNDSARLAPSFALAQRLWDEPGAVFSCMLPGHALFSHGLLVHDGGGPAHDALGGGWRAPLESPALVASALLFPREALPPALMRVDAVPLPARMDPAASARVAAALASTAGTGGALRPRPGMTIIPVTGAPDAPLAGVAAACAALAGVGTVGPGPALPREHLAGALSLAWLRGCAVYLDMHTLVEPGEHPRPLRLPLPALPLVVFLGSTAGQTPAGEAATLAGIAVPPLGYLERLACWRAALAPPAADGGTGGLAEADAEADAGADAGAGTAAATSTAAPTSAPAPLPVLPPGLPADLPAELARRFCFEAAAIARVGAQLARLGGPPRQDQIFAAARAGVDLGALAQTVVPRFRRADLMLPPPQAAQLDELIAAMRHLTRVHHEWGTAGPWNEAGLSALFSGPPGTGKTMAAEVVANELDLPLVRIDLSQVVNKYIGETEKNLRRLFDAADASDVVLFFDEADSLFGKRSEVKDAHDRYANLEISYLLERMERFKGLAILATNRRKDLDEAFLRRLRFAIAFPMPGVEERLRIWQGALPPGVDAGDVDFAFLAQRFPLAGGHIRGIVFHACLQSASAGAPRQMSMAAVLRALQREYDKLERTSSLDQFGPYAGLVATHRSER